MTFDLVRAVGFYALAGCAHELAHVLAYAFIVLAGANGATSFACPAEHHGTRELLAETTLASVALGRHVRFPEAFETRCAGAFAFVRLAGFAASLAMALVAERRHARRAADRVGGRDGRDETDVADAASASPASPARLAFWLTALDAAITDVFDAAPRATSQLLCGNFGIVLLNHAWCCSENGRKAFDVLEKMVYVTMMRGAQSGGVVTFDARTKPREGDKAVALRGARSRVVNMKRTDLSKLVRAKAERESGGRKMARQTDLTRVVVGHTRFATTSKATLDGTHPHQWSPPQDVRVYAQHQRTPGASLTRVENFITHNGDFDFYDIAGAWVELGDVQAYLARATGFPAPSVVDSAAIAGVIDLLRAQGSFALAARFAVCLDMETASADADGPPVPSLAAFEAVGAVFETELDVALAKRSASVRDVGLDLEQRDALCARVLRRFREDETAARALLCLDPWLDRERGGGLPAFAASTVDAFFDNDGFFATRAFLSRAKGSFGLTVTSSLDATRQLCVAARGQTMSVAFYPRTGLICYGSEQAAVKAGLGAAPPGSAAADAAGGGDDALDATRLDLDDLNGEVCLMDWGGGDVAVSLPSQHYETHAQMAGALKIVLAADAPVPRARGERLAVRARPREERDASRKALFHRMTRLEGTELIKPLAPDLPDLVGADLRDIPRAMREIQEDWRGAPRGTVSLNRLTAWNLSRCLRRRLDRRIAGTSKSHRSVDVVVTGCEVSLWLAEQFASDLAVAFPRLDVRSVSANKILGLFGQDLPVPALGHPRGSRNDDFTDSIVIVVSHSGGTFAPLAASNLLVSSTSAIFVVTSEWDTQIGKQLRAVKGDGAFTSRIFSTDVGVRPAEPCSVSVAATQQLLTQIFTHVCLVILGNEAYVKVTGAAIAERDVAELERCNRENVAALEEIVGASSAAGSKLPEPTPTERALRARGDAWADHVLEGAKGWILSFAYVVATVTSGYPLVSGIAAGAGATPRALVAARFLDALVYVFLPQICITLIRLWQGRDLKHRMTARTVVIGDVPWVAQSAEAFLSKLFACAYSAASVTVLSGNPADHLVHRHTHRVVRGALLLVGRPDGRLSALSSAEATVSLSLAQASSIQSFGGTCESVTVGHSPYKLPLSHDAVFLKRHRPLFLCEQIVREREGEAGLDGRSPGSLLGLYNAFHEEGAEVSIHTLTRANAVRVLGEARIKASRQKGKLRSVFDAIDVNRDGALCLAEFTMAYKKVDDSLTDAQIEKLFRDADEDGSGELDFDEFCAVVDMPEMDVLNALERTSSRDARGLLLCEPSDEAYFGEAIRRSAPAKVKPFTLVASQDLSMQLYETRVASLQRFVSMCVMFHQLGDRVAKFWPAVSFGYLGYRMDRTHSIMRIATTASPVSGAEVRDRRTFIALNAAFDNALAVIDNSAHLRLERLLRKNMSGNALSRVNSSRSRSGGSSGTSSPGLLRRTSSLGKRMFAGTPTKSEMRA